VLAVPFFNASPAVASEAAAYASYPGVFNGNVTATTTSRLWGAEFDGVYNVARRNGFHAEALAGFRYLNLQEDLDLNVTALGIAASTFDRELDRFQTRNEFYGGQVGARAGYRWGRLLTEASAKVALGTTHETLNVNGNTTQIGINPQGIFPGGIFSEPTNLGRRIRDEFTVVPEFQIQAGVDLFTFLRAFVGYNFLYTSSVLRPGDQIDRVVNTSQQGGGTLAGPPRPATTVTPSDFWAHGLNFGLQFGW
jgi:hypothetical protein